MKPSSEFTRVSPPKSFYEIPEILEHKSNLGIMANVNDIVLEMHKQHLADLDDILLNIIAFGVAMSTLRVETNLEPRDNDPFKLDFVTVVKILENSGENCDETRT